MAQKFNSEFKIDISNSGPESRHRSAKTSRPNSRGRPQSRERKQTESTPAEHSLGLKPQIDLLIRPKNDMTTAETLFTN